MLRRWVARVGLAMVALFATASNMPAVAVGAAATFRLYDGGTAHVNNPTRKDFNLSLDVQRRARADRTP